MRVQSGQCGVDGLLLVRTDVSGKLGGIAITMNWKCCERLTELFLGDRGRKNVA